MNLIYADLRDARSPHGRVDDNDEGNGDGEREQRDESQPGRNVRRDVQSRMKTDMRRARKFTVGALPLVYTLDTLVECAGISEILTFRETSVVGEASDAHDIYEGEIPDAKIFPKYLYYDRSVTRGYPIVRRTNINIK